MNKDILLYKILIESIPIALLVEDENRNITLTNQAFCDLFEFPVEPEELSGYDSSQAAEEAKHLIVNSEAFIERIYSLVAAKEPVYNELVEMKNGTNIVRDYIPIFNDDFYLGHVWLFKDITHLHSLNEAEKIQLVKYHADKKQSITP